MIRPPLIRIVIAAAAAIAAIAALAAPRAVISPLVGGDSAIAQISGAVLASFQPLEEPVTLLLLGRAGEGNPAPDLTDTIIVLRLSPPGHSSLFVSLPRDLLVPIPGGRATKINALYAGAGGGEQGRRAVRSSVEDITGLSVQGTVVVDLSALATLVDAVGGINVFVRETLQDPRFPAAGYAYTTVRFERGWRWMDGNTLNQYLRTRATPLGDFDRIARQQDALRALAQKIRGLHPLWDFSTLVRSWQTVNDHIETDIKLTDIRALWAAARAIDPVSFRHVFLDPSHTDAVTAQTVLLGGTPAYVLTPASGLGRYETIRRLIEGFSD